MRYMLFNIELNKVIVAGFSTLEQANQYAKEEYKGDLFPIVILPYYHIEL